jgi:predicted secreted protein
MPFATPLAVAIYFTIWWIVLLTVLPLGVRSFHEEGEAPEGVDPGAPVAPKLLVKVGLTTVISALVFAAVVLFVNYTQ